MRKTYLRNIEARLPLLHPFLFAVFPVLALLAENIQQIPASQAYRSVVLAVVMAFCLLLIFRLVFKDWYRAAAFSTLGIILFFSYGHIYSMLKTVQLAGVLVGRHRYLLPLSLVVLIAAAWYLRKKVRDLRSLSISLFLVSLVLLVFPIYRLVVYEIRSTSSRNPESDVASSLAVEFDISAETPPDVYYVILDAYVRADVLREDYGYDNSEFLSFLRDRGFYVAEGATSNYTLSALSLSSSLNMQHLIDPFGGMDSDEYPSAVSDMIAHSSVRTLLEGYGYTTVALSSGWKATEITDADYYLKPQISELDRQREAGRINAFESIFIRTTAGLALIDLSGGGANPLLKNLEAPFMAHHYFVLSQFEHLEMASTLAGPKFVFAHIISPHHPYVFGANGELITSREAFTWSDGAGPRDSIDTEMRLYRDQAKFISKKTEEVVDVILANSERPPIIIVQADHGPGIRMSWGSPNEDAIVDRMSILSAYLLPDTCAGSLYPSITPVNSFAVMFQCVFGLTVELKEDRSYFSPKSDPYNFVDISDTLQ